MTTNKAIASAVRALLAKSKGVFLAPEVLRDAFIFDGSGGSGVFMARTPYLDVEHAYRGVKNVDHGHHLPPQNLVSVEIERDFMRSHGYMKNDLDVKKWAAPEFLEQHRKTWPRRSRLG
jgi:hypothetical protein